MYKWLLVFMLGFVTPVAANSKYFVGKEEALGGDAYEYLARIEKFRAGRVTVVLPKKCWSSCTLYTILLNYKLVCARPGTMLYFHEFMRTETRTVGPNGEVTSFYINPPTKEDVRRTWWSYPSVVRSAMMPRGLPQWGDEFEISANKLGIPLC